MLKSSTFPRMAHIAVTLLCNSKCIMCDIWKNNKKDGFDNEIYRKLPNSLGEIDITGGEPFLRDDLPEIVKILKETCPKAKLLIITNGYLTEKIRKILPLILREDSNIALRVSLDGWNSVHNKIRRLPDFFNKVMKTLNVLKECRVKDIGIIYTLMKNNADEVEKIINYCKKNKFNFSMNIVHDSISYYGDNKKMQLRPKYKKAKAIIKKNIFFQSRSFNPKRWGKAWFYKSQLDYLRTRKRQLPCYAGEDFFYLDSFGNIYMCQFKSWLIGNLITDDFKTIWSSSKRRKYLIKCQSCNDCWIMCSAKTAIKRNKISIIFEFWKKRLQLLK